MTKRIATALIALALAGCTPHDSLPPCEFEDSAGPCVWNAQTQGNGKGRSFWVDENQTIHYLGK